MRSTDKLPLRLVKSDFCNTPQAGDKPKASAVVIEVEHGELRNNVVQALSYEDASALLRGLAMAMVQVIRAQQTL